MAHHCPARRPLSQSRTVGAAVKITSPPYPPDWVAISKRIRARAGDRCECIGECGLHRTHPGPRRCVELNGQPAAWANGKVVLTVAHLNHEPADCRDDNLKAMCQRCHLRYDADHHKRNASRTRATKRAAGSLPLFHPAERSEDAS